MATNSSIERTERTRNPVPDGRAWEEMPAEVRAAGELALLSGGGA